LQKEEAFAVGADEGVSTKHDYLLVPISAFVRQPAGAPIDAPLAAVGCTFYDDKGVGPCLREHRVALGHACTCRCRMLTQPLTPSARATSAN